MESPNQLRPRLKSEPAVEETFRSTCVVLDTNIWRLTLLLKTSLGVALVYFLQRNEGVLGLPEVIEDEVVKHLARKAMDAVREVRDGLRVIEILLGVRPEYDLPEANELEASVTRRFSELAGLLVRVPFTLEHAKGALLRVNAELPPNGPKNQQFKDSAIWEAVLELARCYDVHLVTEDKGFFQGREPKQGLATELLDECTRRGMHVRVYSEVSSCLEGLRAGSPPLDKRRIAEALDSVLTSDLKRQAGDRGFDLGHLETYEINAFLTEQVSMLAVRFEMTYAMAEILSEPIPRPDGRLIARGECLYELRASNVSDVRLEKVSLIDSRGAQVGGSTYIYMSSIGGKPEVKYRLREPLVENP